MRATEGTLLGLEKKHAPHSYLTSERMLFLMIDFQLLHCHPSIREKEQELG